MAWFATCYRNSKRPRSSDSCPQGLRVRRQSRITISVVRVGNGVENEDALSRPTRLTGYFDSRIGYGIRFMISRP